MQYRNSLFIIILLITLSASGQAPYLYFRKITTQDGLSHNKVNCMLQDKRGFMWIGTDDGLNRYDGRYFTAFRHIPGDTSTISGNLITDVVEDNSGVIWISTSDGGMTKYDYRLSPRLQFKQFRHLPDDSTSIPINIVNDLVDDGKGYLWLATNGRGVIRFNKANNKFEAVKQSRGGNVSAVRIDDRDTLWVGRQGGGLMKLNTRTLGFVSDSRYQNLYANLPHAAISSLFIDDEKNVWYGSWDKLLYRYNSKLKQEEVFRSNSLPSTFPDDDVLSFAEDSLGMLWIGGRYYGLTLYDRRKNVFYNYRNDPAREGTIADNTINCIFVDRSGQTWLGTSKGISIFDNQNVAFNQQFLPATDGNTTIFDFYKDEDQTLWIGTSAGLFLQKTDGSIEHPIISYKGTPLQVSLFFEDIDSTLYIGTDFSLFIINKKDFSIRLLPNTEKDKVVHNIIDSRIVSVVRDTIDNHPVLLVSPYGHFIAYYDLADRKWVSRADSAKNILSRFNVSDNLIRRIYKRRDGGIMMATRKFGLAVAPQAASPVFIYSQTNPTKPNSISDDNVYDVADDPRGNYWVTTYGGGLNEYTASGDHFNHIAGSDNLLEGARVDRQGKLWMISKGNLQRYDPATKSFNSFVLPDIEKSGGVRSYIYGDDEGNFYVSGTNYYIRFNPEKVRNISTEPHVFLTDFRIFNESYSNLIQRQEVRLNYDQNYFTLEFSSPEFRTGAVEYEYRLEGIDENWVGAGDRNIASYSNLKGGTYRFLVRASNRKGIWSREEAALNIIIIPPYWERWWFYGLIILLIAGAIYAIYRYRINELLKRQAIRNRIARDLHDAVGSTLSSISVYSQVAKIYKQQKKEEGLEDTLERIGSASSEMISEMNDIVWAINPRNDSMGTMLQRMDSYARPLLQAKNISFDFQYDPDIGELNLEMEQRKNFYLIFKESVNNALKYSGAGNIWVDVRVDHRKLEMEVRDDGKGFETAKLKAEAGRSLSGNGLANMRRRAGDMKGVCSILSSPDSGTTVKLVFPLT